MRELTIFFIAVALATQAGCSRTGPGEYASADAAVEALIEAAKAGDMDALVRVLGEEARPVVESGDPVQDQQARERFLEEYEAGHALAKEDGGLTVLEVGADKWPFPFPLVEENGKWKFDATEGAERVVDRRVGENELFTIQACLAFVDAEREYYQRNPQQEPLMQFAQKLISTDGQKDGLYWPTADDEPPSPVGEGFARAREEGYFQDDDARGEPFHGYIYKVLKGQGPNAKGGAYSYLVGDKMLGGFAVLAVPAEYGSSGVMSFMVNHDGVVYSKDLGENTADAAAAIELFDPDDSWKQEATIDEM
jgi:hypothetical protein